jgi:16S rRNA (uracil1498-N3)-methyltransferase
MIRLHVEASLVRDTKIAVAKDAAQYLFAVMRKKTGDPLLIFNNQDGEWRATILGGSKRSAVLHVHEPTRPSAAPPDLELLFAPIKKVGTDFIVAKATEMGCRAIRPVITNFTNAERVNVARLQANCVEAAEQCGLVFTPRVYEPCSFWAIFDRWHANRRVFFCDEAGGDKLLSGVATPEPAAILIGPEGGFSSEERAFLRRQSFISAVSLGPRILRADTAAVAALALWQSSVGDWQS